MSRVLTHNDGGYRRGCRCDVCRESAVRRITEARARDRGPCDVCFRVHRGRCLPGAERTVKVTVCLPAHVAEALRDQVGWGERSAFVSDLVSEALEAS